MICYSDRAASIFSQRERTNNEEEQAKVRQQGDEEEGDSGRKVRKIKERREELNLRVNQNHLDVADLLLLFLEHRCIT